MVNNNFSKEKKHPKHAMTPYEFAVWVDTITNGEYTVLDEFNGQHFPIGMRHEKCGFEYLVKPNNFKYGRRCPYCAGNMKWDKRRFQSWLDEKYPGEYIVLGEVNGMGVKTLVKHLTCGYEWEVQPRSMTNQGNKCPHCGRRAKKTTEEFKKEVFDLVGDEYTLLEDYYGAHTPIKIRHEKCGFEYYVSPGNFLSGRRCPNCSSSISRGAQKIIDYLEQNKIEYEKEVVRLIEGHNLRFDFYIPQLNLFIEFDGEQHFNNNSWGGQEALEIRQLYDEMKNRYCSKEDNENLLRISYLQIDQIEEILKKELG